MKITLVKIKRHWWFPFMNKEVILRITPNLPIKSSFVINGFTKDNEKTEICVETREESYTQSLCNNWEVEIK